MGNLFPTSFLVNNSSSLVSSLSSTTSSDYPILPTSYIYSKKGVFDGFQTVKYNPFDENSFPVGFQPDNCVVLSFLSHSLSQHPNSHISVHHSSTSLLPSFSAAVLLLLLPDSPLSALEISDGDLISTFPNTLDIELSIDNNSVVIMKRQSEKESGNDNNGDNNNNNNSSNTDDLDMVKMKGKRKSNEIVNKIYEENLENYKNMCMPDSAMKDIAFILRNGDSYFDYSIFLFFVRSNFPSPYLLPNSFNHFLNLVNAINYYSSKIERYVNDPENNKNNSSNNNNNNNDNNDNNNNNNNKNNNNNNKNSDIDNNNKGSVGDSEDIDENFTLWKEADLLTGREKKCFRRNMFYLNNNNYFNKLGSMLYNPLLWQPVTIHQPYIPLKKNNKNLSKKPDSSLSVFSVFTTSHILGESIYFSDGLFIFSYIVIFFFFFVKVCIFHILII
jgi:hypothetical protein